MHPSNIPSKHTPKTGQVCPPCRPDAAAKTPSAADGSKKSWLCVMCSKEHTSGSKCTQCGHVHKPIKEDKSKDKDPEVKLTKEIEEIKERVEGEGKDGNEVEMEVEEDAKGEPKIDPGRQGHGLRSSTIRLQNHQGSSGPGAGTKTKLCFLLVTDSGNMI